MSPLPPAANSGHTVATLPYRSSSPWSARIRHASADTVLVVDQTLMIVSRSTAPTAASVAAVPPHRSTTSSPSSVMATDAPSS